MSECCRKTFFYLAYAVATVGSVAYCFYLIWLLAYLKDSGYYWLFAAIPGLILRRLITADISKEKDAFWWPLNGVLLMLMCSFTMLTRQAYYHLSPDAFIGQRLVIMTLKGSIVFFMCGLLKDKECRLQRILEDIDILSRGLLDFVDIFNMVELLSLNQSVGIGPSVTEGSSLEIAIQAFSTISLFVVFCIFEIDHIENKGIEVLAIYIISLILQNIPFLVIRISVWAKYNVFSLGFMVKNILAIVVCCAEIYKGIFGAEDDENGVPNNVNRLGQYIAYNSGSFPAILFICILSSAEYLSHFVPE